MTDFDITAIVADVGESFTVSGVAKTFNTRGDPTESYTAYTLSGVVQVMDGSEEEVTEGLLEKEDIMVFVDEDTANTDQLTVDNHIILSTTLSGVYRVVNSIKNKGHYEVHGKRI